MGLSFISKRNQLLPYFFVLQKTEFPLSYCYFLIDAGIFIQVVVFAQTAFIKQGVHHFTTFAAKRLVIQLY